MSGKTYGLFAKDSNQKLFKRLSEQGAEVILFPVPELLEIPFEEKIFQNLSDFEWIIFTDIFAAEFFLRRAEETQMDLFELDSLRICAAGESVSDRLRFVQVHSDVIPAKSFPADVFSALREYVSDEEELKKLKYLIVCRQSAKSGLFKIFKQNEMNVTELPVYRMSFSERENLPKLKALLAGGAIDEFVFSSPEDVLFLKNLLQAEDFRKLISDIKLSSSDAVTSQTLFEFQR